MNNINKITRQKLIERLNFISKIILDNDICSYDPFDALKSPYAKNVIIKNKLFSRLFIKFNNLSPINFRKILKILKTKNDPKVLADLIQVEVLKKKLGLEPIFDLIDLKNRLLEKRVEIDNKIGWGLQFPYSSRYVNTTNNPNLFTTVNAGYSLLQYYNLIKDNEILTIIEKINSFIINYLGVINVNKKESYIRYYSKLDEAVFNVNSLALKYYVEYQKITGDKSFEELQNKLSQFLIKNQNGDGSWFYSNSIRGKWIDGFHTGYIIEGLVWYYDLTADKNVYKSIKMASDYYKMNLLKNNFPLYKPNKLYPIDSQNCAQAIQTRLFLYKLGLDDIYLIIEMYSNIEKVLLTNGNYYAYRKYKFFRDSQHYFRWSSSPFLLALCYLYESLYN